MFPHDALSDGSGANRCKVPTLSVDFYLYFTCKIVVVSQIAPVKLTFSIDCHIPWARWMIDRRNISYTSLHTLDMDTLYCWMQNEFTNSHCNRWLWWLHNATRRALLRSQKTFWLYARKWSYALRLVQSWRYFLTNFITEPNFMEYSN